MNGATYERRRGEIQAYFDRTALDAWKRFATDAPLGRIRTSVRQGRDRMRTLLLGALPDDLSGWRVLDAGCGAGALSVALARRGASVLGVDLSPEIVRFAADTLPSDLAAGQVEFRAGDMLASSWGRFDAVVAMDSLIHYRQEDTIAAVAALAGRTTSRIAFTFAPRTPALAMMHGVGRLFPRSDRAPSIVPTRPQDLQRSLGHEPALAGWRIAGTERVSHGFYTSQMLAMERP